MRFSPRYQCNQVDGTPAAAMAGAAGRSRFDEERKSVFLYQNHSTIRSDRTMAPIRPDLVRNPAK